MMTPQHWMVPKQKYAVIHYIRHHYLRERNPSQWTELNEAYLAALPKGDSLGPEPSSIAPWNSMDYGPTLTHTYQISSQPLNIAYKGLAVDWTAEQWASRAEIIGWSSIPNTALGSWLASRQGPQSLYRLKGIQFNGQHNIHPHIAGDTIFANANGPGWAEPTQQTFDDSARVKGRDNRRYGPLPKSWGKFVGQYRLGSSVVVAYQVGETLVHEMPGYSPAVAGEHGSVFMRTVWMEPRKQDLFLKVARLASR